MFRTVVIGMLATAIVIPGQGDDNGCEPILEVLWGLLWQKSGSVGRAIYKVSHISASSL